MSMTIPAPTGNDNFQLIDVTVSEVKSWFHVYSRLPHSNKAEAFGKGWGDTRFAPIKLANGSWVHTYYAASTIKSALSESVLHDVACGGQFKMNKLDEFDSHLVEIEFHQPLRVVSFHSPHLGLLNLNRSMLIDSEADVYAQTRLWAEAALQQVADAEGVAYTSKRNDIGRCVILFEQRLGFYPGLTTPFKIVQDTKISSSDPIKKELMDLMKSQAIRWI